MSEKTILIVEDEAPIRGMLRMSLERSEFRVIEADGAQAARLRIAEIRPDLILMDWMMPGVSGAEFTRELKASESLRDIPVIMVTARIEEEDAVRGLNLGCDDYITKPFAPKELVARVNAVLRRVAPEGADGIIEVGELLIDSKNHRITAQGRSLKLGPTEYRLLKFFASHPDRVYSREQLLDRAWGQNVYVEERTVDVHIRRLRKLLEPFRLDQYIQTVRGAGYRFSINR